MNGFGKSEGLKNAKVYITFGIGTTFASETTTIDFCFLEEF